MAATTVVVLLLTSLVLLAVVAGLLAVCKCFWNAYCRKPRHRRHAPQLATQNSILNMSMHDYYGSQPILDRSRGSVEYRMIRMTSKRSCGSQTDFGYETDNGNSSISGLVGQYGKSASVFSEVFDLTQSSLTIPTAGTGNEHTVSMPCIAGPQLHPPAEEESSNPSTDTLPGHHLLSPSQVNGYDGISVEQSGSSGSPGSVGGRPRHREVAAEVETGDCVSRTPSEEMQQWNDIHIAEIVNIKKEDCLNLTESSDGVVADMQINTLSDHGLPLDSQLSVGTNMAVCGSFPQHKGLMPTVECDSDGCHDNLNSKSPGQVTNTRLIIEKLIQIDWVKGCFSEGETIEVFVDFHFESPEDVQQMLADATSADSAKFKVKHSFEKH